MIMSNRSSRTVIGLVALSMCAMCLPMATRADTPAPAPTKKFVAGKNSAPIRTEAQTAISSATLTLTFDASVTDLDVRVYGVDGLKVTSSANPIAVNTYAAGSTVSLNVTYEAPVGDSELAVSAKGAFRGSRRAVVKSFTVHNGATLPLLQKSIDMAPDATGKKAPIRVMPAETR